jgi:hypothetical protein
MHVLREFRALSLLVSFGLLLGCGGGAEKAGSSGQTRQVKTAKLPKLGEPFPQPLDDDRVTLAPPDGWDISPRNSKWMVRFQKDAQDAYPSIIIYADADTTGIGTVTNQNANEFAKQVVAELTQGASQKTVLEPLTVGSFVGVNYERRGKAKHGFKDIIVQRAIMETVVAGRRYKIDLRTRDGDLHQYRPHALAVAGGMKFLAAGGSAAGASGPAETPTEPDLEPEEPASTPEPAEKPAAGEPEVEFEEEL